MLTIGSLIQFCGAGFRTNEKTGDFKRPVNLHYICQILAEIH